MENDKCLYCPQQLHNMCQPEELYCCCHDNFDTSFTEDMENNELNLKDERPTEKEKNPMGRPIKTDSFKDLLSTGRKRAAMIYAPQPGQMCAWAWKKNCGGGIEPIIGCSGRPAKHIHHGPDKSVLNNKPNNISVVCTYCHNKWHGLNDKYYEGERPEDGSEWYPSTEYGPIYALSDAIDADPMEVVAFELDMKRPIDNETVMNKMGNLNEDNS